MNIDILFYISILLGCLFCIFVTTIVLRRIRRVSVVIIMCILCCYGFVITFILSFKVKESIMSDYDSFENINRYEVHDITFEKDNMVVHYLDQNKEVKHIKSTKAKIFYDLTPEQDSYIIHNKYWRWFIYWDELELHTTK